MLLGIRLEVVGGPLRGDQRESGVEREKALNAFVVGGGGELEEIESW